MSSINRENEYLLLLTEMSRTGVTVAWRPNSFISQGNPVS